MEEGRKICSLPDSILVDIISRLDSTEEAIRTSILAKRWQYLWPSVSNLLFTHYFRKFNQVGDFLSKIDQTLSQCDTHFNLNKFQLNTYFVKMCKSQINDCVRYAVSRNVRDLSLTLWNLEYFELFEFELDESFFAVSCFTRLRLSGVVVNPGVPITWKNLRSLCISRMKLDEDVVQNILHGCPVLETLELKKCYGFGRLDITSKSVKSLVLSGYNEYTKEDRSKLHDDVIEINAPYILSLTFRNRLNLWMVILLNVSSLVKANLNYTKRGYCEYDLRSREEAEEDMLKGLILSLNHVEDVTIGVSCMQVFTRLKAQGFTFPSNLSF